MIDRNYYTQELLKLFPNKNQMIETFTRDLVELVPDEHLNGLMMDVCVDSDNQAQYSGMNFKVVTHYAMPYIKRRFKSQIEIANKLVGEKRCEYMLNNTHQRDNENYDVFYNGVLLASTEDIANSFENGFNFWDKIEKKVVQHELKEEPIAGLLN